MSWTFTQPPKTKEPGIQYILKVGICPLTSRSSSEGSSLHDVRFLFSQMTFFLSLLLTVAPATSSGILLAVPNTPPSGGTYGLAKTLRPHLIGAQNQLKNWNKLHKLPIIWTKQNQPAGETLTKHPNQLPIKRQDQLGPFSLLCSCSVKGCQGPRAR